MDKLDQSNIIGPIKHAGMVVSPEMEIIAILEIRKIRNIILPIPQNKFGKRWRLR